LVAWWSVELQPAEFHEAHRRLAEPAFLNALDFQYRYFHGQLCRFARDTPD
jgi:hypothetical protein